MSTDVVAVGEVEERGDDGLQAGSRVTRASAELQHLSGSIVDGRKLESERVFTTGAIAKLCKVAPRTVSKWIDGGKLVGYRLPGSLDRRVTESMLRKFMEEEGLPIPPALGSGNFRVMTVGSGTKPFKIRGQFRTGSNMEIFDQLAPFGISTRLGVAGDIWDYSIPVETVEVESLFAMGTSLGTVRPHVVVLDAAMVRRDELFQIVKQLESCGVLYTIALLYEDADVSDWVQQGAIAAFRAPWNPELIRNCIISLLVRHKILYAHATGNSRDSQLVKKRTVSDTDGVPIPQSRRTSPRTPKK